MALLVDKSGGRSSRVGSVRKSPTPQMKASTDSTAAKKPSLVFFDLPDGPSEPDYDLGTATVFIHGEAGIGKTSLAKEFPDAVFLMFEPGARFLRVARIPDRGQFSVWAQFVRVVDKLILSDKFATVVIDTADLAYELCLNNVVEQAGEDWINEGSLGYGKGFDKADAEFKKQILRITGTGRGVVFISHTKSQEFERSTGVKYPKLIPTIKDRGRRFLNGFCDLTGCYLYDGNDRWLVIRGSSGIDAKCRIDGRFLTPAGKQVHSIPMGETSKEAYQNFITAFNNLQSKQNILTRAAVLSEVKAKIDVKKKPIGRR